MSRAGPISPAEQFKAAYLSRYLEPLAECEARLIKVTREPGGTLGESCALTLAAGGKRLRPLLVFLSAGSDSGITEGHLAAAVAVELVHMATLVHDDVLDGADLRRGMPTIAARYGHMVSTAAGDYLFSSAFDVLSASGDPRAISLLAATSLDLSLGELVQREQTMNWGLSVPQYEERCRLKTAGLFSAACCLGALFSGCSQEVLAAMHEFGHCLGLAFQIADDILDFDDGTAGTGKRTGADLRDGTVNLPLIFALEKDDALAGLLGAQPDESLVAEICLRVRGSGALEAAAQEARSYAARAREALSAVVDEIEAAPLELIAQMAADRSV